MLTALSTVLIATAAFLVPAFAQTQKDVKADERLNASADVLNDMMKERDKGIPRDLIEKSQCLVIVPGMKSGAFIFGGKYGVGFASCRLPGGGWSAPAAMRVEGGSFGLQIGGTDTDVVLLVMNQNGMKHLESSKFTVGGQGSVAAGPVGREATAQTMHAEMLSYSRAHGAFAGISLQGSTLRPDESWDKALYGRSLPTSNILEGGVKPPEAAARLESELNAASPRRVARTQ